VRQGEYEIKTTITLVALGATPHYCPVNSSWIIEATWLSCAQWVYLRLDEICALVVRITGLEPCHFEGLH
jgi:hypothetical protein